MVYTKHASKRQQFDIAPAMSKVNTTLVDIQNILCIATVSHLELIIIIIIKRISRALIYHTRWQHRALYNNTNHTHTHTQLECSGSARMQRTAL